MIAFKFEHGRAVAAEGGSHKDRLVVSLPRDLFLVKDLSLISNAKIRTSHRGDITTQVGR
jgi:hypothetical protein